MEKQIAKWLEKGLITKEVAMALIADVHNENNKKYRIKLNITIYTIAAILIGIGVISFIAANDWIIQLLNSSELLKILLMFLATGFSLWGGYKLAYEKKNYPKLGNALFVLSSLLIGGTYALIGQTYNINANNSSLVLLWLISIIPVAYAFKNYAVNFISIVLFILWIIFFYADLNLDHFSTWTIFIPILIGTSLYSIANIKTILKNFNDFSLAYKLTGLIPIFVTLMIMTCHVEDTYNMISLWYLLPLILLIILNIANYFFDEQKTHLLKIETVFISSVLLFMILLLSISSVNIPLTIILANIALITIICYGFNYGYKFENARIIGTTNWFLIIYLLINYSRWGWSFMDKALFFILGGILLLTIGIYLEKKRKEILKGDNDE